MNRIAIIAAFSLLAILSGAAQQHAARGLVLHVDSAHHQITVSCDPIPGYMAAMDMAFAVRGNRLPPNLKPGSMISFTIVEHGKLPYAENIQPVTNFEPEPAEAGSLNALDSAINQGATSHAVNVGQPVPDFTLTDQNGRSIGLSQFRGKVVAITFGYSRCPNPNYCLRLSRNLGQVEKRFHDLAGSDLVLMTIAIDPEYDQGPALASYAQSFGADANSWHFLTGTVPQIHQVAGLFGMNFWNTEGLITHTLHTVIIDRRGLLAANIDGNQFSPQQLGDLVLDVMNRRN